MDADPTLHIILVQPSLKWGDKSYNLRETDQIISGLPTCDLIVLPEMFNTGFLMDQPGEDMTGESAITLEYMARWSKQTGAAICGSIAIREAGKAYNRFLLVQEGSVAAYYDKRHLFGMLEEDRYFSPGNRRVVVELKGWRIQPFICYDLRFPAWCRNTEEADLQLYVANWPAKRIHHWKLLLQARAVENQCYVAGVNAVGTDNFGNVFSGDSTMLDYSGETLGSLPGRAGWMSFTLSKKNLLAYRKRYPFLQDRDQLTIE